MPQRQDRRACCASYGHAVRKGIGASCFPHPGVLRTTHSRAVVHADAGRSQRLGRDPESQVQCSRVGRNAAFADGGAIVLGHRNVRRWIHTEHLRLLTKDSKPPVKAFMEASRVTLDTPAATRWW
jgi:hypothetical protein